jgi:hypothetical protein
MTTTSANRIPRPTILAPPFAARFVDNQTYDHIDPPVHRVALPRRPAEDQPRRTVVGITERDRQANNIGASLVRRADPALDIDRRAHRRAVRRCEQPTSVGA